MSDYVDVCDIADIANGRHKAFTVGDISILLFNLNGRFHAIRNRCTHLDFPLENGRQMGWEIVCRQHGARFDIRDGAAIGGPAVQPVAVFPVRTSGSRVEVSTSPLPALVDRR